MSNDNDLTLTLAPYRPGVAMIDGSDTMAGLVLGRRAERVIACVNACVGLNTGFLESAGRSGLLELIAAEFPENMPLYKDSGLWQMRSDDMENVLVEQEADEKFHSFVHRCWEYVNNATNQLSLSTANGAHGGQCD